MKKDVNSYAIVGVLQEKITSILNITLPNDSIYLAPGVKKHIKKKHKDFLKYLDNISEIIANPDYVGVHPNEPNSVEMVKIFDDIILVSMNLSMDTEQQYLYVSSLYDISDGKLQNRINSGRLIKFE